MLTDLCLKWIEPLVICCKLDLEQSEDLFWCVLFLHEIKDWRWGRLLQYYHTIESEFVLEVDRSSSDSIDLIQVSSAAAFAIALYSTSSDCRLLFATPRDQVGTYVNVVCTKWTPIISISCPVWIWICSLSEITSFCDEHACWNCNMLCWLCVRDMRLTASQWESWGLCINLLTLCASKAKSGRVKARYCMLPTIFW